MPSLREKLATEQSEAEKAAISLREKLAAEQALKEQEAKLKDLRAKITKHQEQKQALDEAVVMIKGGYTERAESLGKHKKAKGTVKEKEKLLKDADEVVKKLYDDFRETFESKGIKTEGDLLLHSDYQDELEVKGRKVAETQSLEAKEVEKAAVTPIREKAATLRGAKKKAIESAPALGLEEQHAFSNEDREDSMKKFGELSKALAEEIEKLQLQTPEGQEAAKEKLNAQFAERYKEMKFFERQFRHGGVLVKSEDIEDARKYGPPMVEGALRLQVEYKLKNEVEKEKGEAGILESKQELDTLKTLPGKYDKLVRKARELSQRREEIIKKLTEKGSKSDLGFSIQHYFRGGSESGRFQMMLKDDFARAYLLHIEKNYICEQFYGGKYNWSWDKESSEGGVPIIVSNFLQQKQHEIQALRDRMSGFTETRVNARNLFDPNSLETEISRYEKFLSVLENIVENHPESIAKMGRGISGSTKPNDLDLLRDSEINGMGDSRPFQLLDIKNPKIQEGLNNMKRFADVEADVKKGEEPFDKAYAERKEFLDRLIEQEWSGHELQTFQRMNPKAYGLQEKAEIMKAQKLACAELAPILLKTRELVSSQPADSENTYDKFSLRLQEINSGRSIHLSIIHPDLEPLRKKREIAESELKKAKDNISYNKREKRPRFSLGTPKLDKELAVLEEEEKTKLQEFQTADGAFQAVANLQSKLGNHLYPMTVVLDKGRFNFGDATLSVSGFLERVQKIIDNASSASLPPEEEQMLKEYEALRQNHSAKQKAFNSAKDAFDYILISQLQAAGWKKKNW